MSMRERLGQRPRLFGVLLAAVTFGISALFVGGTALAAGGGPSGTLPVSQATTAAYVNGTTVQIQYPREFYCGAAGSYQPMSSSGCEVGAAATTGPDGQSITNMQTLYVVVPLFANPMPAPQCPIVGECVNHPTTLDLSQVFGSGYGDIPLPAHSHILDGTGGGWWKIDVVAVPNESAWTRLTSGASLSTLTQMQAQGAVSPTIPSNLFLFFNVVGH